MQINESNLFPDDYKNPSIEFNETFYRDREFKNVIYREKIIKDTEFYNCTFLLCDFIKSKMLNCEFEKCSFISCDLSLIIPNSSKFVDVSFSKSKVIGIDWSSIKALSAPSDAATKSVSSRFYFQSRRESKKLFEFQYQHPPFFSLGGLLRINVGPLRKEYSAVRQFAPSQPPYRTRK